MWDYDKLFAEGNIVGFKHSDENQIHPYIIYKKNDCMDYFNDSLCYKSKDFISKIQYIIRLDEHGNVVEKMFDREKDMPSNPMPDLEDNMFIRVQYYDYSEDLYHPDRKTVLGYVDMIHNRILYQDGRFAKIENGEIKLIGCDEIVEVYKGANSFGGCLDYCRIWRNDNYQSWLNLYGAN